MRYANFIVLAALLVGFDGEAQARNPRGTLIASGAIGACSGPAGSSGGLVVSVGQPRVTGISPFLVFFSATATTDSNVLGGANNVFQDVYFSWDFGDSDASGTGKWATGSNPGGNSKNKATGGVASHLYIIADGEGDTPRTAQVTATDGTHTVTCTAPPVTVYDASGANGFPTTATVCAFNASVGSGCPSGASTLTTSNFNTALSGSRSNKRVLFKCGDTFTGDLASLGGTKWDVGAYGTCPGTKIGLPIIQDSGTGGQFNIALTAGDGRIVDLDFEGNGTAAYAVETNNSTVQIPYQITLANLISNGNNAGFAWAQGAQWGLIDSQMNGMRSSIGTFVNFNENNPGTWTGNVFNNLDYQALLGDLLNGVGNTVNNGSGQEVLRISACRFCSIENNTIENANSVGGVLKLHNGNTSGSSPTWSGVYTEYVEVSDNWLGGTSGAITVDIAPQNNNDDERLRNLIFERNLIVGATGAATDGRQVILSGVNFSFRDNVCYVPSGVPNAAFTCVQAQTRGVEPAAQAIEIFNNTAYWLSYQTGGSNYMVGFDNLGGGGTAAKNSFAENNLYFVNGHLWPAVTNNGTGNTVSNNTATSTNNPAITNASTTFSVITDFKPTANFSGATNVPVWYDALGIAWPSTWDLGAVKH